MIWKNWVKDIKRIWFEVIRNVPTTLSHLPWRWPLHLQDLSFKLGSSPSKSFSNLALPSSFPYFPMVVISVLKSFFWTTSTCLLSKVLAGGPDMESKSDRWSNSQTSKPPAISTKFNTHGMRLWHGQSQARMQQDATRCNEMQQDATRCNKYLWETNTSNVQPQAAWRHHCSWEAFACKLSWAGHGHSWTW